MKLPLLFLLAMITPVLLAAVLVLPIYGGILGATYIIYTPASGPHPLAGRLLDVFYIVESYSTLLGYWINNMKKLSLVEYALPIVGLPVLCTGMSLWLTWRISRWLLNMFHLSASIN